LALSNSLSREEMAAATGLTVSEVSAVIKERAERLAHERNVLAHERVRRHMPDWPGPDEHERR
jgi:hypothetical protein